jgi:Cys-rich protein (TIGR01571 family)
LTGERDNAASPALVCASGGDHGPTLTTDMFLWKLYLHSFYGYHKRAMGDEEGSHYKSGLFDVCQPRGSPVTSCKPRGDGCLLGCTALWCPCCVYSEITGRLTPREFDFGSKGNEYSRCEQVLSCFCYAVTSPFGSFMPCNFINALVGCNLRKNLNRKYNTSENDCEACATHLFCPSCSLAQLYREVSYANPDDPVTKTALVGAPPQMWMGRGGRAR